MDDKWEDLSPDEKSAKRFQRWLSPPGIEFNNENAAKAYQRRVTRLIDTIGLNRPDRVPAMLPFGFFPAYYAGLTLNDLMYDYDELQRVWKKFITDIESDTYDGPGLIFPGKALETIGHRIFQWPGYGLPENNSMYQYVEGEYMRADEYDDLIKNPSDFWLRKFMPRIFGALEPFRHLAPLTPQLGMPFGFLISHSRPDVQKAYQALFEAGKEAARWVQVVRKINLEAIAAGLPSLKTGGLSGAPFDMIGDMMRGTKGIFMDMYRQPEKLLEAIARITPLVIDEAVAAGEQAVCPVVFMPLHKGDDMFMSKAHFEKFYWPSLREVALGLIDAGLVPLLFAEGKYVSRLDIIGDLPKGKAIWWFEQTDMALAKKHVGDTCCIAGNVPVSMLCTESPAAVKAYCRQVIESAGKGGGLILTGGASMDQGNPDNLRAMMTAAREYGVYQ